jgi:hypothetical protein
MSEKVLQQIREGHINPDGDLVIQVGLSQSEFEEGKSSSSASTLNRSHCLLQPARATAVYDLLSTPVCYHQIFKSNHHIIQKQSANSFSSSFSHCGQRRTVSLQSFLTRGIQKRTPVKQVRQTIHEIEAQPGFFSSFISPVKPHSMQLGLLTGCSTSLFLLVFTRVP